MKKTMLMVTIIALAMILAFSLSSSMRFANAQGTYSIESVNHVLSIMSNGYVLLNDTIRISGQAPSTFLFGLPYHFGTYVVWYDASDANSTSTTFPVTANQPFENKSGFYSLEVDFPTAMPQNLSINVLFSNRLVIQDSQNSSLYTLIFPAFPSLTTQANICNVSVNIPATATFNGGSVNSTTYSLSELSPFTYNVSSVSFLTADDTMQAFDVGSVSRRVNVNEQGNLAVSDAYSITNEESGTISSVQIVLPVTASGISASDQLGRAIAAPTRLLPNSGRYDLNVTNLLAKPLGSLTSTEFTLNYELPTSDYLTKQGMNGYQLSMSLFYDTDYYVNASSVTFLLPEGADVQTLGGNLSGVSYTITKDVFSQSVAFSKNGVSFLEGLTVSITYQYNLFWSAFRPTTWAMFLSLIGCIAVVLIRRPQAHGPLSVPVVATRLRPEYLRSFLDSYEEKRRITADIESLEERARKGKIPRQRYKIQLRTFETRLETLSRTLNEYKERMRSAGGHYASLMRELEVAETDLNEVETNLRSIETRHSRGELSLEGYKKLLGDYERRKERTQTTIDGVLLRLREEIQ